MRSGQWTRAETAAHKEKLLESYRQLLSDLSSPDLHTVGNYTLGRLIGKGSFGKVYLGHHKLTNGTKVVLKSARRDDPNLAREIHHHRQFVHPHIARLYEVILTESLVWLVLEYCPGDELLTYVAENGRIEPDRVQKIFAQLVGAVTYVHSKRCVHRDLKLENILLDKNGNVKLVDFGFTREYDGKNSVLQTWCGTVCYSAPEMLLGEKYAADKVDMWSLGVILYALLAGELPFDCEDEAETRKKIVESDPLYPDYLPEAAVALIKRMLSKRPFARPSFDDVLSNHWLAEHAPEQRAILSKPVLPPFSTEIEHETLLRMKSAGVDVNMVMQNVVAQKCDPLAGWWALLVEKETRKAIRRERRLAERDKGRRASMAPSIDRIVSPLRLDTSRSRRGSRFGAESIHSVLNSATSPTAQRDQSQIRTPQSPKPVPVAEFSSATTTNPEPGQEPSGSLALPTGPSPTSKNVPQIPELSVSSHSSVSSPSKGPGLPIFGHFKQWLRLTTRRDPREPLSPTQGQAPQTERRRLGFSAAAAGFRLHRDRKRGSSPPALHRMALCVDPSSLSRAGLTPVAPPTSVSPPSASPNRTSVVPSPLSARTDQIARPSSRGRTESTRLTVPVTLGGFSGPAAGPSPRRRSASGSSPLRIGPPQTRRHSSLRGRKSASSSLSSIRSLRPHPSHSKASSTSSITTTMTSTTVGTSGNALPAISPGRQGAGTNSVPVSIGAAARAARVSRLASPIPGPAGVLWKAQRGRSLSSGSGASTPGTSVAHLAGIGIGPGSSLGLNPAPGIRISTDGSESFSRPGLGVASPRARRRPGTLSFGADMDFGRIAAPPLSPGLAVSRRRPFMSSPLGSGLSLNLGSGSGNGVGGTNGLSGPLGLGTLRGRGQRKRSNRGSIIEEQEDEDDDGIEEVDEFEELGPGEEVCYHDPGSPDGEWNKDGDGGVGPLGGGDGVGPDRAMNGRHRVSWDRRQGGSIDMRVNVGSATLELGDLGSVDLDLELAHSPPDSPCNVTKRPPIRGSTLSSQFESEPEHEMRLESGAVTRSCIDGDVFSSPKNPPSTPDGRNKVPPIGLGGTNTNGNSGTTDGAPRSGYTDYSSIDKSAADGDIKDPPKSRTAEENANFQSHEMSPRSQPKTVPNSPAATASPRSPTSAAPPSSPVMMPLSVSASTPALTPAS